MLYFKSIVSYYIIKRNENKTKRKKTKPWTSSTEIIFHRFGTFIKSCEVMCSSWLAPLRCTNRKIHISSQLLFSDLRLRAWNWLLWEYLHHGNWHIRALFYRKPFASTPVVSLCIHLTKGDESLLLEYSSSMSTLLNI